MTHEEMFVQREIHGWAGFRRKGLLACGAGIIISVIALIVDRQSFFTAYLLGWSFCMSITLGCLLLLMVHHLSGGRWGLPVRRSFEAGALNLIPLFLLAIPIFLGRKYLYPWADPAKVAQDQILRHKSAYLNAPFVGGRAVLFFGVWTACAVFLSRWSRASDAESEAVPNKYTIWMRKLSAGGLFLSGFFTFFFAIDWIMSLEPRWYSTGFSLVWAVGAAVAGLSYCVISATRGMGYGPIPTKLAARGYRDLVRLMFAVIILWSYVAFVQFLIIWAENLPEEIPHYLIRNRMGWKLITFIVVVGHFILAFYLLAGRRTLEQLRRVAATALILLALRWIQEFWIVVPPVTRGALHFPWAEIGTTMMMLGFLTWLFARRLESWAPVPKYDEKYLLTEPMVRTHTEVAMDVEGN